jgi:UDP-glucose 4-epimerase
MCKAYSDRFALGTTILRFFNVYGPRQERSTSKSVISNFVDRLRVGTSPEIRGDGLQTRDFIYVADVVDAIVLALEERKACEVYNIGTGTELSIINLLSVVGGVLGCDRIEPELVDPRPSDIRRSVADIRKARSNLSFYPRVSLESGLRGMLRS